MPATVVLVHDAWHGAWCWDRVVALMLDTGESVSRSAPEPPGGAPAPASEIGPARCFGDDGATVTIDPVAAREIFDADCADADIDWAIARLGPHPAITFQQPVPAAAWRDVPSTYVVCVEDRAIAVWIQHTFAERATNSVVWPTSHSPFLSQPDLVVDLVAALATA